MKAVENAFLVMCVSIFLSGCQPGTQTDTLHADRETYRKEVLSYFDFEQEPLKSDVKLLNEPQFEKFKVTDNDLKLSLGSDKHYYKFFYYSRVDTMAGRSLVTMLAYYETYYDLLLVAFDGEDVADKVVIASFAGDTEDFDNIHSQTTGAAEWSLVHVTGKRFFENDSTAIHSRIQSKVEINDDGFFETKVTSNQAADPAE